MNRFKKYFTPLITGVIAVSLSSCAAPPTNPTSNSASSPTAKTSNTLITNQLDTATSTPSQLAKETSVATQPLNTTESKATSTTKPSDTLTINIYQADNQCRTLIPEKATVPAGTPVTTAVGKVLKQADSADFALAGYRVSVDTRNQVATVDLRRTPNSRRQFVSLSICEQFALFGSLRKTLVANSQFKIKDVRFTEQGQEIKL